MSLCVVTVLVFVCTALGEMGATGQIKIPCRDRSAYPDDSNASDLRIFVRFNHSRVVDSLTPVALSSESITPSKDKQPTTAAVAVVLAFVGLCAIVAMIFFFVRYFMRRAAVKRRRQASWILRSGQWNMEPKRANAHDTRTGYSDTSSSFSAYPYPLSEHF